MSRNQSCHSGKSLKLLLVIFSKVVDISLLVLLLAIFSSYCKTITRKHSKLQAILIQYDVSGGQCPKRPHGGKHQTLFLHANVFERQKQILQIKMNQNEPKSHKQMANYRRVQPLTGHGAHRLTPRHTCQTTVLRFYLIRLRFFLTYIVIKSALQQLK